MTSDLLKQELWSPDRYREDASPAERIPVSYMRARSIVKHVGMTVDDITSLSPKFWELHLDYIMTADAATAVILVIHWNLCMGTIASHLKQRPDLGRLLRELEDFDTCGDFMLTEVGQGLDARNIETTATQNADGSFDLNTPRWEANKVMPPTTPLAGIPRVAVVFAQLIVDGDSRGVRPFIVRIHGEKTMMPGVTSRLMPARAGATSIDHAITTFDHVRLEASALLGDIAKPQDAYQNFLHHIQRVTVGSLSLSMIYIPVLRLSAYILGRYSQQRLVSQGRTTRKVPIMTFSTQHTPILTALTTASVLQVFADDTWRRFRLAKDDRIKSALACIVKQTATHPGRQLLEEMIDRCGWRGLYPHNQIIEMTSAMRGNSIAEGDVLVLCIRLASELLLGRYAVPKAADPTTLLAQHEAGVWKEASDVLAGIRAEGGTHRSDVFNARILPRARNLIQAIGDRMSYEAAVLSEKISPAMLELYETTCVLGDISWYVENLGCSRAALHSRHAAAVESLLPSLDEMLEATGAGAWATAPMLSAEEWKKWADGLTVFKAPKEEQLPQVTTIGSSCFYRDTKSVRVSVLRCNEKSDGDEIAWESFSQRNEVRNLLPKTIT
ncbi:hypothetical protein XA68_14805 [Ophiocordyceps unilateralis]|uniref:Acyl-CoA oxidase C-alpha1 domain-containing protein n=1 Tax=Ophiocordyceps unilateralis TaxID=268505 RepID=A0A2A9P8G0_OPHUN|nr:hypothetical protein XA68_14805 [Ophiocordyceps unilateralis]